MPHSYNNQKRDELLDQTLANIKHFMNIVRDCDRLFNPDPDYSDFNDYNELCRVLEHTELGILQELHFLEDMVELYRDHIGSLIDENRPEPKLGYTPHPEVINKLFK
jgi:hypothetical protein